MEQKDSGQEEPASLPEQTNHKKRRPHLGALLGAGAIVVLLFGIAGYAIAYQGVQKKTEHPFLVGLSGLYQIPVATINGQRILYRDYINDRQALKKFYTAQQIPSLTPPTDEQISDQALSRLLVNQIIQKMAADLNVSITKKDIKDMKDTLLQRFPDQEAATQEIQNTFGWPIDTFIERVMLPLVLERKVAEAFLTADLQLEEKFRVKQVLPRHILFALGKEKNEKKVKAAAESALKRIKDGESFDVVAKELSDDPANKETGGVIGWISPGMTLEPFEKVVFSTEPGTLYDKIVKTDVGYHAVQVDAVRDANNFDAYMADTLRQAQVDILPTVHNPFQDIGASLDQVLREQPELLE